MGRFQALAGTTYYIALAGTNGAFGALGLQLVPTPLNDDFADRQVLEGTAVYLSGTTVGATREPSEGDHAFEGDGASVWFSWTAPLSGTAHLAHSGDGYYSCAAVYTGSELSQLNKIASACWGWQVDFPAQARVTYQIALAGYYASSGPYTMTLWLGSGAANDNFVNRIALVGTNDLTISADNTGATRQPGEPRHAGDTGGHSLWWSYYAPVTGTLLIDFSDTGFIPDIGVYTGSELSSLKAVPVARDYFNHQALLNTVAGATYQIAVDGYKGATGGIGLSLNLLPVPLNDNFANRIALTGTDFSLTANNRSATREKREPNHDGLSGAHSLWWSWTAPLSQAVCVTATGEDFDPYLAIYTGTALTHLVNVASNYYGGTLHSQVVFTAVRGRTYQLALDSAFGDRGKLTLSLLSLPKPPNDDFAQASVLTGQFATALGTNAAATCQLGEPAHAGQPATHSLWWQWTPQFSGPATIDTQGSFFDTVLAVYTGTSLNNLAAVASNDDLASGGSASQVTFNALAGTRYWIAVDGFEGAVGEVSLRVSGSTPLTMTLATPTTTTPGRLSLHIQGALSQSFLLQTSTNLVDWTSLSTNQFTAPVLNVEEPIDPQCPGCFYRVLPWP